MWYPLQFVLEVLLGVVLRTDVAAQRTANCVHQVRDWHQGCRRTL